MYWLSKKGAFSLLLVLVCAGLAAFSLTLAAQPRTVSGVVSGQKFGTNVIGDGVSVTFEADSAAEERLLSACSPGDQCKVVVVTRRGDVVTELVSAERLAASTGTGISVSAPVAVGASGPSFPCSKAATRVERIICADPALAELDMVLAARYRDRFEADPQHRAQLQRSQRDWMGNVRATCDAAECLSSAYRKRIAELNP